jgi:hypothetical protein
MDSLRPLDIRRDEFVDRFIVLRHSFPEALTQLNKLTWFRMFWRCHELEVEKLGATVLTAFLCPRPKTSRNFNIRTPFRIPVCFIGPSPGEKAIMNRTDRVLHTPDRSCATYMWRRCCVGDGCVGDGC